MQPPVNVWLREHDDACLMPLQYQNEPGAVRYVRADLYDALVEQLRIARWLEVLAPS